MLGADHKFDEVSCLKLQRGTIAKFLCMCSLNLFTTTREEYHQRMDTLRQHQLKVVLVLVIRELLLQSPLLLLLLCHPLNHPPVILLLLVLVANQLLVVVAKLLKILRCVV